MKNCYTSSKIYLINNIILILFFLFLALNVKANKKTFYIHSDTYVASGIPGGNFCNETSVAVSTYQEIIGLLYFYIGNDDIPRGSKINKATLRLYCTTITDNSNVVISRISGHWNECTVNWNNRPGRESPNKLSKPNGTYQWWEIDVTNIVEKWIAFDYSNYGFGLEKSSDGIVMFNSSENSSNKPELIIDYTEGNFSASGKVTSTISGDVSLIDISFSRVNGSGSVPNPVKSGATGTWEQSGFAVGATYRATPSKQNYVFAPSFIDFNSDGSNVSNINFTTSSSDKYSVTIHSNPSGAYVRYTSPDGTIIGTTPCTLTEQEGNKTLYITKTDYEPIEYILTKNDADKTLTFNLSEIPKIIYTPPYANAVSSQDYEELTKFGFRKVLISPSHYTPNSGKLKQGSLVEMYLAGQSTFFLENKTKWTFNVPETGKYKITVHGNIDGKIYTGGYGGINDYKQSLYVGTNILNSSDDVLRRSGLEIYYTWDEEGPSAFWWVVEKALIESIKAVIKALAPPGWVIAVIDAEKWLSLALDIAKTLTPEIEFNHTPFSYFNDENKLSFEVELYSDRNYQFEFAIMGFTGAGLSSLPGGFIGMNDIVASFEKVEIQKLGDSNDPILQISPELVEIPPTEVGSFSDCTNAFKITNVGEGQLNGEAIIDNGSFDIINNTTYSLNKNESSYISVRFSPNEVGNYSAGIVFTGVKNEKRFIYSSAFKSNPELVVVPEEEFDFGIVEIGENKTEEIFTVFNSGGGTLVGEASTESPFTIINEKNYSLKNGESKTISIKFEPITEGLFEEIISFSGQGLIQRKLKGIGNKEATQTGSLNVTLDPSEAVNNGAKWNVDGGVWQNSGATVSNLSVGTHIESFKTINGWSEPESKNVVINENQTTSLSEIYTLEVRTGSLRVSISPIDAIIAGAKWNVDNGPWKNSGTTVSNLSEGSHTVKFENISAWIKPEDKNVTISAFLTKNISAVYTQESIYLDVNLDTVFLPHLANNYRSFYISCNMNWETISNAGWLALSPLSGSNDRLIYVWARSDNTSNINREATVKISGDNEMEKNVTVIQFGNPNTIKLVNQNDRKFTVIPNPNTGAFIFRIDLNPIDDLTLKLMNPIGQIIEYRQVNSFKINHVEEFDVRHLSKGIYYLKIFNNKYSNTEKIIVN
ncbi:MAG: DNRLRE domain-containing protein [Mariniphaga sp.]|nr:DNRLRE domain-containing protein [Mariniphaga sp.]